MNAQQETHTSEHPLLLVNPINMPTSNKVEQTDLIEADTSCTKVVKIPVRRTTYRRLTVKTAQALSEDEINRLFDEVSEHLIEESSGQDALEA